MTQLKFELSQSAEQVVETRFREGGVKPISIERRAYPEETIFIVRVSPDDYVAAGSIGNTIDHELTSMDFKGFVTVRTEEGLDPALERV